MADTMIITSYLPTYRTPPSPEKCIDWTACDLVSFGGGDAHKNIVITENKSYTFPEGFVYSHFLEAIAKRYIMQHPEMIHVEPERLKKGFALSMLYKMAATARNCGDSDMAIISGTVDSLNQPDELLSFEYVTCSLTINRDSMLRAVKRFPGLLEDHLKKRVKDKRYGYLKPKRMHKIGYWMDPDNWTGFAGGFILDYYIYKALPLHYRQSMWQFPQRCYKNDKGMINSVMAIDQRLATVFEDPILVEEVARTYAPIMGDYYGTYYLMNNPLPLVLDTLISEMVQDPNQYKQKLIERKQREEAAQRQQGPVLQDQGVTLVAGQGISYLRIQLDNIVQRIEPEPAVTRQVPVYGADGSIIGTERVPVPPVNEAREELERMLAALRN